MKAAFGWLSRYFSRGELLLWGCSMGCILLSFAAFDRGSYLTLAASLIGATSLIFCAKGNPAGQVLMILFSLLYGLISFFFAYYGEMLTYLGMTAPMAVVSLVSWLRNPFQGNHSEVEVNRLPRREIPFMLVLTAAVTIDAQASQGRHSLVRGNATQNSPDIQVSGLFASQSARYRRQPV